MLPTLTLQLSSAELLDDTYATSVSPLPGPDGTVKSGFADLLALRVDASLLTENSGGELLPHGGSGLPLLSDMARTPLATENLPVPKIDPGIIEVIGEQGIEGGAAVLADLPDIVLETPVLYPQLDVAAAAELSTVSSPIPAVVAVPRLSTPLAAIPGQPELTTPGAIDSAGNATNEPDSRPSAARLPALPSLVVAAREASPLASLDELIAAPPSSIGLRERGELREPQSRTAPVALASPGADSPERLPIADATRRLDLTALQRVEGLPDTNAESLQSRVVAPQPGQLLQTQLNTQFSQAPLTTAPTATPSVDVTYAGVTQQTTDLIGTSVRDSAWGNQLSERVVMMAGNQLKSAEIRLTPAELGPLRVRVSVDDGAANVTFHAQHAVTREAIEQALPRLREMLAENGLSLGQADVSERGVGEGNGHDGTDHPVSEHSSEDAQDARNDTDAQTERRVTTSNGLVDTFA